MAMISRQIPFGPDSEMLIVSVSADVSDASTLAQQLRELDAVVGRLGKIETERCDGCYVGVGKIHTTACRYAESDIIELARAEMEETIGSPA